MCFKHVSFLFLVQKKKSVVNVVESEIYYLAFVNIEKSRQFWFNENINHSLCIICNFTRVRVFKLEEETFVIHSRIYLYFAKQTLPLLTCIETHYFQCSQQKKVK